MEINNELAPESSLSSPLIKSPPLLRDMKELFQVLSSDNKRIFTKLFDYLWRYSLSQRYFKTYTGVLYSYWLVEDYRSKAGIFPSHLAMLSFLYYISEKGKFIILPDRVFSPEVLPHLADSTRRHVLNILMTKGYIVRTNFNSNEPYLKRSRARGKPFIRLTPKAINFLQAYEKFLRVSLHDSSWNQITGAKEKPVL